MFRGRKELLDRKFFFSSFFLVISICICIELRIFFFYVCSALIRCFVFIWESIWLLGRGCKVDILFEEEEKGGGGEEELSIAEL